MNQGDPVKTNNNIENNKGEITINDVAIAIRSGINYIKSKWLYVLIISTLGAITGLWYSIIKEPTYLATCTFVLEDARGNSGSQYGGLAALAGINLGAAAGGIFEGDNILELYKSRTMIEKTLLNTCIFNEKKQLLIDRFIDCNDLRSKEKGDKKIGQINFSGDPDNFNRTQDSVITGLVALINTKVLTVSKPDKKLSIIGVSVVSRDELFSKFFNEKIVQTVNDFYIQTKTKKASQNLQILQRQADSVRMILNLSINGVASANDADPNANPLMSRLRVISQKKQVDVQANTAIYSQMLQNVELAKVSLRQDMPLIQVIDKPVLPLAVNSPGKIKYTLAGAFISAFLTIGWFFGKKMLQKVSNLA